MKKLICIFMTAFIAFAALTGCSKDDKVNSGNEGGTPTGKVVINFEGTVTEVNDNKVTLDNGKIVVISSDTVFAGDPDTNSAVSKEIAVGNFIQGYTADDPEAARVEAGKIYFNEEAK